MPRCVAVPARLAAGADRSAGRRSARCGCRTRDRQARTGCSSPSPRGGGVVGPDARLVDRHEALQLLRPVKDHCDLCRCWSVELDHQEAIAIGMHVVGMTAREQIGPFKQELRCSERDARRPIHADRHHPPVALDVKQFPPVVGPRRVTPSRSREWALVVELRESRHVDFGLAGLVRGKGDPFAAR